MDEEKKPYRKVKVKIDTHQTYGRVLGQAMKCERWTGAKLGAEVGVTRNHISEIVSGKNPSYMLAQRICDVFGYELRWCKKLSAPKKKKKDSQPEESTLPTSSAETSPESLESAENSTKESSKGKIKKLKDLQEKVSASKKETADE